MKKKNGFTLIELLAVIVILALIMIIAIPSVLNAMNNARRNSFVLYLDKIFKDTPAQYVLDAQSTIPGAGVFAYDIENDLNYTSTGNYHGYVIIDATDVDNPEYYIYLWDNNYMIYNYPVTKLHSLPTADDPNIVPFDESYKNDNFGNAYIACKTTLNSIASNAQCQTPKGAIMN